MTRRQGAAFVLVGALAVLGGSIAWAVDSARGGSWAGHRYAYGPSMMGFGYSTAKASPVGDIAHARQRAQTFADRLGLKTSEVVRFERNYYVKLVDAEGRNATEALVDPETGATSLEYGPAMMWNTKYGMMSGRYGVGMMRGSAMQSMMGSYGAGYGSMMGGSTGGMMGGSTGGMMGGSTGGMMNGAGPTPVQPSSPSAVSLARAHMLAQRWLDANEPGTKVETGGDAFPGYYTLETLSGGRISGMLSVNAATGVVWPHWWHGRFLERSE